MKLIFNYVFQGLTASPAVGLFDSKKTLQDLKASH